MSLRKEKIANMLDSVSMVDGSDDDGECSGGDFESDNDIGDPTYICQEEDLLFDDNSTISPMNPSNTLSVVSTVATAATKIMKRKRSSEAIELQEEEDGPSVLSTGEFCGALNEIRNDSTEFKSMRWKKKNLQVHVNEVVFRGVKEMPSDLMALKTPYQCFKYFVTDEFLQNLADQMNLYACQKNIDTRFTTNAQELRQFIGILFFMSVYRYPNVRSYWGKYGFQTISETMSLNRFEEIRSFLHFNDDSIAIPSGRPGHDKLHKVRPLVKYFNERFVSVPMLQRLCIDEQMCCTKMRGNPTRQYIPAKPHKWGTKLFVLCDYKGFSYSFEIYSGAGGNVIPENAPDLGASSNVVVRLSAKIPQNVNHICYYDNFYTSLGLLTYLRGRGIYSLGTVRANRVPNIKLSTDAELVKKKVERGYSEEYVGTAYGVDITSVLWQDNKPVRLLSTYVGVKPFLSNELRPSSKSIRWDRKIKQQVEVDCPFIIKEYNRHMGGVDLMDGLLGRYHIRMKTNKWTNRLFFHLLDVAMVNAYILYHRLQRPDLIELPIFRSQVAEAMCKIGPKKPKGRCPSQIAPRAKQMYGPSADVRYDNESHWCAFHDRIGKKTCKLPGCKSETQAYCTKCMVNLCNSANKSCFITFHQRT